MVAVAPGAYELLLGKAFGLVGLREDARVREEPRPRGQLVCVSPARTLGHAVGAARPSGSRGFSVVCQPGLSS